MPYVGGVGAYRQKCDEVAAAGYEGFDLCGRSRSPPPEGPFRTGDGAQYVVLAPALQQAGASDRFPAGLVRRLCGSVLRQACSPHRLAAAVDGGSCAMRSTAVLLALTVSFLLAAGIVSAWAQPGPGDLVVVDLQAGTGQRGAVFVVNPVTGMRRLLSDLGNPGQGPIAVQPNNIAVGPGGDFFVIDRGGGTDCFGQGKGCGALLRVDRASGARTLVSDFGVETPAGPPPDLGLNPTDVVMEPGGQLLVTDSAARFVVNQNVAGVLFRVDPFTGARTVVSDFTNPAQGPIGARPFGVAVAGGSALVTDPFLGLLFQVDLATGTRTVLNNFRDPAQGPVATPPFPAPVAATADIDNRILVVDQVVGGPGPGLRPGLGSLWSVDAGTGARTVVSDFTTAAQGPIGSNLSSVKLDANNQILVMDFDSGTDFLGASTRSTGRPASAIASATSAAPRRGRARPRGRRARDRSRGPASRPAPRERPILPASRSVQVGQPATAFVTIIDAGASTAKAVGIPLQGCTIPATITYQTTDPATNALTGTINTPVDITAGKNQTFVVAVTPTKPFAPSGRRLRVRR